MRELSLGPLMYSRHTSGYHSYKGQIGTINRNLLNQKSMPPHHLPSYIRILRKLDWQIIAGDISVVMDGASREIITTVISEHANLKQLASTIDNLAVKLPINSKPILHSDQGWQYQHSTPNFFRLTKSKDQSPNPRLILIFY